MRDTRGKGVSHQNKSYRLLLYRNLVDAFLMTSTLKLRGEKLVHNAFCHRLVDEATGHHQHVGVVVLADQMGYLWNPAETGTDALMLVECHADALTTAADGNAGKYLAFLNTLSQGMTEVGVVT